MTTLDKETVTCAICGEESEQTVIGSTNTFGSPDLDLRPPPMKRQTMAFWLQACRCCGYAAYNIGAADDRVRGIMRSDAWIELTGQPRDFSPDLFDHMVETLGRMKARVTRSKWPPEDNSVAHILLRHSVLAEGLGETLEAAYGALWAAWAEDDRLYVLAAENNRKKAAALFKRAIADNALGGADSTTVKFVLIDVLRRAEQWDEALAFCRDIDAAGLDTNMAAVLRVQQALIAARDVSCYKVADAVRAGSSPPAGGAGRR